MKCWGIEDTEEVLGLKSSARMCICGKCLFLLSCRYISSAEQIVLTYFYSFQKYLHVAV